VIVFVLHHPGGKPGQFSHPALAIHPLILNSHALVARHQDGQLGKAQTALPASLRFLTQGSQLGIDKDIQFQPMFLGGLFHGRQEQALAQEDLWPGQAHSSRLLQRLQHGLDHLEQLRSAEGFVGDRIGLAAQHRLTQLSDSKTGRFGLRLGHGGRKPEGLWQWARLQDRDRFRRGQGDKFGPRGVCLVSRDAKPRSGAAERVRSGKYARRCAAPRRG